MSSPNLTREEARERAELLSDLSYDVALDLDRDDDTFGCDATIRFRCAEPSAETFVNYVGRSVERILLNGAELPIDSYADGRIRLRGLAAENELRVLATGAYEHTGVGMHRFRDPVDDLVYTYSDAEPFDVHRVYPCFDQPDLKGRFSFSVTAPAGWEVVSNAPVVSRPPAGEAGPWTFERTAPIPTYVTAVVAGAYHVARARHGEIDLGLYCRRSLARYLEEAEILEVTRQGFDFYERSFGYRYPFGKYDQVFVPEFNSGAMENVGCVTFHEDFLFRSKVTDYSRERRAEVILHEMAHMWFGNLVTMRWWDDLWLNESFASWAAVYSQARATRWGDAWVTFADSEKTWAYRQDQLSSTHPIVADIPDIASTKVNFDGITYAKGASVLRQLVAWVGEEAFLEGIRTYFRRHEYGNTTLQDFLRALEEASGRDLGMWSKEWLEEAGVNTLRPRASATPLDGGEAFASFSVEQEAPAEHPTLRSHRVAIGLYDAGPDGVRRRSRVERDVVGRSTPVPELAGQRVPDLVLLNDDDLTFAKIRLDARSVSTLVERLADVRDPLARTLCWTAAWDMARDAELPARRYLDLVLRNVHGESVIGVVQSLLAQAATAVSLYGDPANRRPGLERLAAAALTAAREVPPAGDHQLAWSRCFIGAARSEEHLAIARELLEGAAHIPGLTVDTDLRWHIVRSLAAAGALGEDAIAAEQRRDPTDKGSREAATARASRPTPQAKLEAWRAITEDDVMPFATLRALVAGFHRTEQEALVEPFMARYFDALQPIWESRNLEVALAFANGMYPRVLVSEATVRATEDYLAAAGPVPPLRRVLVEGRDDVLRALRTRAADR